MKSSHRGRKLPTEIGITENEGSDQASKRNLRGARALNAPKHATRTFTGLIGFTLPSNPDAVNPRRVRLVDEAITQCSVGLRPCGLVALGSVAAFRRSWLKRTVLRSYARFAWAHHRLISAQYSGF